MANEVIGVVGGGLMGVGIATKCALAGLKTTIIETDRARIADLRGSAADILSELVEAQIITHAKGSKTLGSLHVSAELPDLAGSDIVIEAIPEILSRKQAIFAQLEGIVSPHGVIASNTSSFPPNALCEHMVHKERFVIAHFWNPPHVIPLVEVVPGTQTQTTVINQLVEMLEHIGSEPVVLKTAIPGFIGNRLQFAMLREALHIVRTGAATPETVDAVMKASLGRRYSMMGPIEGADLGGLNTFLSIASHLMPQLAKDECGLDLLREHTEKGELGVSTGRGFYTWDENRIEKLKALRRRQLVAEK
ncbi:3-hydroxyacyl-CoA dehydrogenase family protein [Burkholderia cepacia]|uniref:3-hydroxyacyl-CoA dehydrogenase family protein n=1 Tax=Burkholderia cepacia TaxID=292 RepID=UPI003EE1E7B0